MGAAVETLAHATESEAAKTACFPGRALLECCLGQRRQRRQPASPVFQVDRGGLGRWALLRRSVAFGADRGPLVAELAA